MDTIYYLSRFRNSAQREFHTSYRIREHRIRDYRLIQVALGDVFWEQPAGFLQRRQRKRYRQRVTERLQKEIALLTDRHGEHYFVRGRDIPENFCPGELFPVPEFVCYLDRDWVVRLLPSAVHPHFIVLGNVPYLPDLLRTLARRMRSLIWILPDHFYAEMLEDFAEDFYQEYGLAVDLRFPEADETYAQVRIEERKLRAPVNVLDFTEKKCIPRMDLPPGSIWLDMAAMEEKERKIVARGSGVTYLSLKKQWEHP